MPYAGPGVRYRTSRYGRYNQRHRTQRTPPLDMVDSLTAASHRVIRYAVTLLEELQDGETRDLDAEQATLTNLLRDVSGPEESGPELGARYALVSWLDELFTVRSPWSADWNEQKLESTIYGSNDRAREFWRQAKLAEAKPNEATLSVYFLCVALGFRGELRADRAGLDAWVQRVRARVTHVAPRNQVPRAALSRRTPVRQLHGCARTRRFAAVASVTTLCAIPLATYALVQRMLG